MRHFPAGASRLARGRPQEEHPAALGNIVGSNIFNISLILGLSSQVMPLNSSGITAVDYAVMIGAAILPMIFGIKGRIGRFSGVLMFACFIVYNWYLLSAQMA